MLRLARNDRQRWSVYGFWMADRRCYAADREVCRARNRGPAREIQHTPISPPSGEITPLKRGIGLLRFSRNDRQRWMVDRQWVVKRCRVSPFGYRRIPEPDLRQAKHAARRRTSLRLRINGIYELSGIAFYSGSSPRKRENITPTRRTAMAMRRTRCSDCIKAD